jgi:putative SOS response-associated peptidase YedK
MCGRFTQTQSETAIASIFNMVEVPPVSPRYNISPTQLVATVVQRSPADVPCLAWFHWGLIPSWAKDSKMGARLINARSETVAEKPSFRQAFRRRRCLILADGFFEWQQHGRTKEPFYIHLTDRRLFALAGLWEQWRDPSGTGVESCTILTTVANAVLRPIHLNLRGTPATAKLGGDGG